VKDSHSSQPSRRTAIDLLARHLLVLRCRVAVLGVASRRIGAKQFQTSRKLATCAGTSDLRGWGKADFSSLEPLLVLVIDDQGGQRRKRAGSVP
jgi:hypothetical protein